MQHELTVEQLYKVCDAAGLDFATTTELAPPEHAVGQQRALESLDFGIGLKRPGYNIFVMGATGAGRHTLARGILHSMAARAAVADDWCYVANFDQPYRPEALRLPPGRGRRLQRDLQQLLGDLLAAIPAAFQSEEYRKRIEEINESFKRRQEQASSDLNRKAKEKGVALIVNPNGFAVAPLHEGRIMTTEEFDQLPAERQRVIESAMAEMEAELKAHMSQLPVWQRELHRQIKALNDDISARTVSHLTDELEADYADLASVADYLRRLKQDVIDNAQQFIGSDGPASDSNLTGRERTFNRYRVNLLVDHSEAEGAPVVYEDSPTYQNLLGRVEHIATMGTLSTDFTLIKPGALHRANGGYLLLDVEKVLTTPFGWEALKRVLRAGEIRIESLERRLSLVSTVTLEPEAIPLDLKVVLIGDRYLYYLLKAHDPEFGQLFKVAADFAHDLRRTSDNERLYARVIAGLQQSEGLRPLSAAGVARLIEAGARRARHQDRISLHIGSLVDLMQEADYWAGKDGADVVGAEHVRTAIDRQIHRLDQIRERMQDALIDGTLLVESHGVQLAQVNGLSVVQLGDFSFGMPSRISATARMGSGELIDIEREIDQGGSLHSKGVLILGAYLAWRYAKNQPLSVAASLVFEQTYGEVDGDSASVAELCALLSALADIPLRQNLAITGSVSQHGEVQAIGGVCEKIEGFFDLCQARGLHGDQGVIIPRSNVQDLMLREDVREAVAAGRFHVYAVDHVEEAMQLLTGMSAGRADTNGLYPPSSINGSVQIRLAEWTALRQHYASQSSSNT